MDINDLMADVKNLTDDEFSQKLNKLVRENYRYANLNKENKKIVSDLVGKYKREYLWRGRKVPPERLEADSRRLYTDRAKLGLTDEDIKDIREVLTAFE